MSPATPALLAVDWWALGPVIALSAGICLLLLLEFLPAGARSGRGAWVSLFTLAASAACVFRVGNAKRALFEGMFLHDGITAFMTLLFCGIGAISVLLSWDYIRRTRINLGEYYALMLSAILGMVIMAASSDLITIFLGLELMSLALYVLVGFQRSHLESSEASMKYFLLGAFASGFLLYGIALLYGATGTTNLMAMTQFVTGSPMIDNPLLLAGALLTLIGFGFKVAAVPFHMWTPDAYQGAPTSVTAFMSAGAKAAGFAAFARFGLAVLEPTGADWRTLMTWIAVLTMTVGNVTALFQTNVKRMLAYSSIAHAGYVIVALIAGGEKGVAAALFYLAVYSVMNLGAFGVLTLLGRENEERVLVSDLAGLGYRHPALAAAMALFMVSLGGIPPTAGFMGKVYVFGVALEAGMVPLVVIGVLNSVVSVFYYLRITVAMYMEEPRTEPVSVSRALPSTIALLASAALTIWWGIQAHALLEQARRSVQGMM